MKRMMKKIGGLSLCAVMCAAALAGCGNSGGGGSSSDGTVTIKFVHKFPEEQRMAYFEEIIADFEEANSNIKIEMTAYGDEEIKDKTRVLLGSADAPGYFLYMERRAYYAVCPFRQCLGYHKISR